MIARELAGVDAGVAQQRREALAQAVERAGIVRFAAHRELGFGSRRTQQPPAVVVDDADAVGAVDARSRARERREQRGDDRILSLVGARQADLGSRERRRQASAKAASVRPLRASARSTRIAT